MFPIPSLYLKLAGAAVVAASVGFHVFGDVRVKKNLAETQAELVRVTEERRILEEQIVKLTQSKEDLDKQLEASDKARAVVRADLNVTLKKLRAQKPPTECKAAIDWAVQNKDDLKW